MGQIRNLLLAGGHSIPALQNTISGNRLNVYGSMACSNRVLQRRLSPARILITATLDSTVRLRLLHINCDQPAGGATIAVSDGSFVSLHDDGVDGDDAAGDGIYSANWKPSAYGTFNFSFPGGDTATVTVIKPYAFTTVPNSYVTIAGTNLNISDETFATLKTPFPIHFGGQTFDTLYISDNGYLSLDQAFSMGLQFRIPWPSEGSIVAPFWDDLNPIYPSDQQALKRLLPGTVHGGIPAPR